MPLFFKLTLCIIIAILTSGFYTGWVSTQSIYFEYSNANTLFFYASTFLTLIFTNISFTSIKQFFQFKLFSANKDQKIGTVKWFSGSKGFGFIVCSDGEELFVHFRSIRKGSKKLNPGSKVQYKIMYGDKGAEATDVFVV
jgi:CspA family cold shock protein